MGLVTRELSITYGSFTVSAANNRLINGYTYSEDSYERASIEFEFVTTAATEAAFATECAACEAAFRIPRGDLIVTLGSNTLLSLKQSDNTGLDAEPYILKSGQVGDTGRSRVYRVRIVFGRPADNVSTSGRRSSTVSVAYSPSRKRRVTISGTYTAIPTSGTARAQYAAQIATYAASVMSGLSITNYELAEEPVTEENSTNKTLTFTRVYDEIVFQQVSGTYDDSAIVRHSLKITRSKDAPGDAPGADRLATITAVWDCWIDKDVTTALDSKYSSIRSHIVNQVRNALSMSSICLVHDAPDFDFAENRISATLTLLGVVKGNILEYETTNAKSNDNGYAIHPAWTGDPLSAYVYQGFARVLQTITIRKRVLGSVTSAPNANVGAGGGGMGLFGQFFGGQFAGWVEATGEPIFNPNSPGVTGIGGGGFAQFVAPNVAAGGGGGDGGNAGGGGAEAPNPPVGGAAGAAPKGKSMMIPLSSETVESPVRLGLDYEQRIDVTDITEVTVAQLVKVVAGGTGKTSSLDVGAGRGL